MATLDITIIGGTICGIIMVVGGILLLYKGAIRLEVASKDPSLTLELFAKQFKLTTHAPALGLFVIGLLFVGLSIYFAERMTAAPIELVGDTEVAEGPVRVLVRSEWELPTVEGKLRHVLRPNLDVLWILISAPGHRSYTKSFTMKEVGGNVDLGAIKLRKEIDRIQPKAKNIPALPPGIESPPVTKGGSFGGGSLQ